jgi:FkbH-like protein
VNFLEASRLAAGAAQAPALPIRLAMSGLAPQLDVFLGAAAAVRGRKIEIETLPYGTLGQFLHSPVPDEKTEILLLAPWDLVPELDWRTGFGSSPLEADTVLGSAQSLLKGISNRAHARILYMPVSVPPNLPSHAAGLRLETDLADLVLAAGGQLLEASSFSLDAYLQVGSYLASSELDRVAHRIVDAALAPSYGQAKVLVTDLDNVVWKGVVAEAGLDGIEYGPEGEGFGHFLYQTFLRSLERAGILLCAVSRNDPLDARAPLESGRMILGIENLVTVVASYHAKSAQIAALAQELNLGLDAMVFVDDNPIELAEVRRSLPEVTCVHFPPRRNDLPAFFDRLRGLFSREDLTEEDRERSALYRRRLSTMAPVEAQGEDLTDFLASLGMELVIHNRTQGDRTRVVQLINKTNQFNLNGKRWTDDEVGALLEAGGRLHGATLSDRSGSHGEILACLESPDRVIEVLVMSCRVFQRRVEHAFLGYLAELPQPPVSLRFGSTDRNEPFRHFLADLEWTPDESGVVSFDASAVRDRFAAGLPLTLRSAES